MDAPVALRAGAAEYEPRRRQRYAAPAQLYKALRGRWREETMRKTNRFRTSRLPLLLMAASLASACTRPTTVEGRWADGVSPGASFNKILVVGVTPAYTTRCRFERMLQESLGAAAVTSCSRMSTKDPLTRDAIVQLVGELGADAVLSTRLVDGKAALAAGNTDEARGENYYKPAGYGYVYDPYYGGFGVPVVYGDFVSEAPALTLRRTVVVASNFYQAKDAAIIYTLDTATYDKESQFEVIDDVTAAIAKRLRRDGLVR